MSHAITAYDKLG